MLEMGVFVHTGDLSMSDIVEYGLRAEELGYHGFWPAEESGKDSFAVLAVMATALKRMEMGTGIVSVYSRTPTLIAMAATTVDQMTGGRMFLGLGTGGIGFMIRGHGIAIEKPLARVRECVQIVRGLLTGEKVTYDGKFFQIKNFHLRERPFRKPFPIYISALNPKMTQLAGEIADGVIYNFLDREFHAEVVKNIRNGAARAGRDPGGVRVYTLAPICVEVGSESALEPVRKTVGFYCASPHYYHILDGGGWGSTAQRVKAAWDREEHGRAMAMIPQEMLEKFTLTGTKETVKAKLRDYKELGIYPIIYPLPRRGRMKEDMMAAIELAAELGRDL